jgi:hypothetical protein
LHDSTERVSAEHGKGKPCKRPIDAVIFDAMDADDNNAASIEEEVLLLAWCFSSAVVRWMIALASPSVCHSFTKYLPLRLEQWELHGCGACSTLPPWEKHGLLVYGCAV